MEICNFADDTTPFLCVKITENVLKSLEENLFVLDWFEHNNYMNFKTDKCHLLISSYKHEVKVGEDKNLGKK